MPFEISIVSCEKIQMMERDEDPLFGLSTGHLNNGQIKVGDLWRGHDVEAQVKIVVGWS